MKKWKVLGLIVGFTAMAAFPAFAGEWKRDDVGYWYVNDDGTYSTEKWQEIDSKWYYFDGSGYMVHDTDIDGYHLGSDGAMIDGLVASNDNTEVTYRIKSGTYASVAATPVTYDDQVRVKIGDTIVYNPSEYHYKTIENIDQNTIRIETGDVLTWDESSKQYKAGLISVMPQKDKDGECTYTVSLPAAHLLIYYQLVFTE